MLEYYGHQHYSLELREKVSPLENIQGTNIRPLIIGDGAYPNTSWMVKPYPHNIILDHSQRKFNRTLSSTRSLVERSFGLLKARFQCLLKRLDNELENITMVIICCCVPRNICQMTGEELLDEEILDQIIADMRNQRDHCGNQNVVGDNIRELLREYLDNNN